MRSRGQELLDRELRESLADDERVRQMSPLGKIDFAGDLLGAAFGEELAILFERTSLGLAAIDRVIPPESPRRAT